MHITIDSSGLLIMFCICILRLDRSNLNVYHGTIKWEAYVKFLSSHNDVILFFKGESNKHIS